MAELLRIHPLAGRRFANAGLSLEPCPPAERLSLRAGPEALPAIGSTLGLELPTRPRTSATGDGITALWLGPDEWLLIGPQGTGISDRLGAVVAICSIVDISHRNTAIMLDGGAVESVIASGCPQDVSLSAFPAGACSRTLLGKSEIVLLRESDTRFRVECWRSFSDYVWKYLVDAAKSA